MACFALVLLRGKQQRDFAASHYKRGIKSNAKDPAKLDNRANVFNDILIYHIIYTLMQVLMKQSMGRGIGAWTFCKG